MQLFVVGIPLGALRIFNKKKLQKEPYSLVVFYLFFKHKILSRIWSKRAKCWNWPKRTEIWDEGRNKTKLTTMGPILWLEGERGGEGLTFHCSGCSEKEKCRNETDNYALSSSLSSMNPCPIYLCHLCELYFSIRPVNILLSLQPNMFCLSTSY